jgi:hypothetical protein
MIPRAIDVLSAPTGLELIHGASKEAAAVGSKAALKSAAHKAALGGAKAASAKTAAATAAKAAAVPIICFEWLQRPENVLDGHRSWSDIRPSDAPNHVRIDHHKTNKKVLQPLDDDDGQLFPELEAHLKTLTKRGVPVVVTPGER